MTMDTMGVKCGTCDFFSYKFFLSKFSQNNQLDQIYFTIISKFSILIYHFHHFDAVYW